MKFWNRDSYVFIEGSKEVGIWGVVFYIEVSGQREELELFLSRNE